MQNTKTSNALRIFTRVVITCLILFVIAIVVVLVVENRSPTLISFWLFETPELPLVIWLVVVFLFGLMIGSCISLVAHLRQKKRQERTNVSPGSETE